MLIYVFLPLLNKCAFILNFKRNFPVNSSCQFLVEGFINTLNQILFVLVPVLQQFAHILILSPYRKQLTHIPTLLMMHSDIPHRSQKVCTWCLYDERTTVYPKHISGPNQLPFSVYSAYDCTFRSHNIDNSYIQKRENRNT